jgi:hypothetical protein
MSDRIGRIKRLAFAAQRISSQSPHPSMLGFHYARAGHYLHHFTHHSESDSCLPSIVWTNACMAKAVAPW